MSKLKKTIIIVALTLTAFGAIFLGIGISTKAFSNDKTLNTTVENIEESFDSFNFKLLTAKLEFKVADDGINKVECIENEKMSHEISVVDNTLNITVVDNNKWYEHLLVFDFEKAKFNVYLNKNEFDKLNINTKTGDVKIGNEFKFNNVDIKGTTSDINLSINHVDNLNIKLSTGEVVLENINSNNVNIDTSTGNCILTNVMVLGNLVLDSSTGNHTLTNVKCENLKDKTSTGNIKLINTLISLELDIYTSTGNVNLDKSDATTLRIKTSTGNVKGSILTNKSFNVKTSTGKVDVPNTTGKECYIETSTGNVKITIA